MDFLIIISLIVGLYIASFLFYKKLKNKLNLYFEGFKKNYHLLSKLESRIHKPFIEFDEKNQKDNWLVITSFNRKEYLKLTIQSARKFEKDIKILVVDNGSSVDVLNDLYSCFESGQINKLILNKNNEVQQWQKSFSIAQAFKILSLESVRSITFSDDDILIEKPWLNSSENILQNIPSALFVNLMYDEIQDSVHQTIEQLEFDGETIKLKRSFNGSFFYFPLSAIKELGLPPINEGFGEPSVEDWYYSRLTDMKDRYIATVNKAKHLGYGDSVRENMESIA